MAATATTTADTVPSSATATRRAMLPRRSVKTRSGRRDASWARRRADPVPTRAPAGRPASVLPTRPSRASARRGTAPSTKCTGMTEGMSLAECTAASARPSPTAASTSVTKTPCPPIWSRGADASRSPRVRTTSDSTTRPGWARRRSSETNSAWHRANGEPRVARRMVAMARLSHGRHYRSKRMRSASTSRSPRGVPADSFKSMVGSCSILARAARVAAST